MLGAGRYGAAEHVDLMTASQECAALLLNFLACGLQAHGCSVIYWASELVCWPGVFCNISTLCGSVIQRRMLGIHMISVVWQRLYTT